VKLVRDIHLTPPAKVYDNGESDTDAGQLNIMKILVSKEKIKIISAFLLVSSTQGRNQTSIQEEANLPSPLPHHLSPPLLPVLSFPFSPPYPSLPLPLPFPIPLP